MCGRYAIIDGKKILASFPMLQQAVQASEVFQGLPQYNAAPMQKLPVVAVRGGALTVQRMQWWLGPHWSKEPVTEFSTVNAKCETLEKSRLFGPYFKGSRCLVPADAFYEWKKSVVTKKPGGGFREVREKHPMCIRLKSEEPFMFAGLFSVWTGEKKEEELASFTIITTSCQVGRRSAWPLRECLPWTLICSYFTNQPPGLTHPVLKISWISWMG